MIKIRPMGRKPLGKEKYHFTCPPDLLARFDKIASKMNLTRSDLIVSMIRDRVAKEDKAAGKEK